MGDTNDVIVDIDAVDKRAVLDSTKNQHGQCLIDFLLESRLCIVNGRVNKENDNYTCISAKGKSVVDYIIVPHNDIKHCTSFCVLPYTDYVQYMIMICCNLLGINEQEIVFKKDKVTLHEI